MTGAPPKLPTLFSQLMALAAHAAMHPEKPRGPWPANPFPSGIRRGSTTDRVLAELVRAHPESMTAGQLRANCEVGRGAVAWAMAYLRSHGLVQAVQDPRQCNYRRYRATPEAMRIG